MDISTKLRGKVEQWEVFTVESEATKVGFEANTLKSAEVEETRGAALRVVANGRLGFAASTDPSAEEALIANALESAKHGDEVPLRFPARQEGPRVAIYDERVAQLSIPQLVEMGRQIIEIIRQADPDAHVELDLVRRISRTRVVNSAGGLAEAVKSPLELSVMVERVRDDDVLVIYDYFGTTLLGKDYLDFARDFARKLTLAKAVTTIKSGPMPVLFSPLGAMALVLPLVLGLNGKNVYRRISPLTGKAGERLFDENLTVVDDGTLDGRPASAPHDDEGVPRRRNVLIERGMLKGFLYDLKTAVQAGVESTASGSRGLFSPPAPAPSNLIVEGGGASLEEMLADMGEGLLVDTPLGLGQGNVISGAFANPLGLAFKVERGEIVGRVKDVSIAGNIYQVLREIAALGRESRWVHGDFKLPYILLPSLNVVSKD